MNKNMVGSFSLIKKINTNLIINTIRKKGLVSRTEIAKITGLTPATVSNLTAQLIESRLIAEAKRGASSGGRKPILLHINENAYHIAGVYIGSASMEIIISNLSAKILERKKIGINHSDDPYETLQKAVDAILEMRDPHILIMGAGIGVHGLVDSKRGVSVFAPNLGWQNINIKDFFEERLSVPVFVDNDVRLMSMGENSFGIAKGETDFVFLYIGYGIGGSIVVDNELYSGNSNAAGEIGHTTVEPDGPVCSCGNRGCLQAVASEQALAERMNIPVGDAIGHIIENREKEPVAAIIEDEARYLGLGIANLINTLDPSLVVINGRITGLGDEFMRRLTAATQERSMIYRRQGTRIVFSSLGEEAVLLGSSALVLKEVFENICENMCC